MLPVGQPDQVDDALGAALEDLRRLAARKIVNPYREGIFRFLLSLGRVRDALAVGRERRPSVVSAVTGRSRFGTRVRNSHDRIVAPDVNRGRLARDAFGLRTVAVAVVDVRISADESDRARWRRTIGNRREGE